MPEPGAVQVGLWLAAFWCAVILYAGDTPTRFALGLLLGALLAHLGWIAIHWSEVRAHPGAVLSPEGFTVLAFPLGLLLLAPTGASFRSLPIPLAVARLGCVVAGCCDGTLAPWGAPHPTALYEIACLVALHFLLERAPIRFAMPVFLMAFAASRVAISSYREAPQLAVSIDPILVAMLLGAIGISAAAWQPWRTQH